MFNNKIVVTSSTFAKTAALKQKLLQNFSHVEFNQTGRVLTTPELIPLLQDAEGALVGLDPIDEELLKHCPKLKIVSKFGVGIDNIDTRAMEGRKIALGWTAGVNRYAVAEHALGLILGSLRNLFVTSEKLRHGEWVKNGGTTLFNKTVGIIGLGHVGSELALLLSPFRCRIIAHDIADKTSFCAPHHICQVDLPTLLQESDIVSIHVPLTDKTFHLLNKSRFALMKPTAWLINTSRGPVLHQKDLKAALQEGKIAGAALDVFEEEPVQDLEFLGLPNLVATAHTAGNAKEAVLAMGESALRHLVAFFGQPTSR